MKSSTDTATLYRAIPSVQALLQEHDLRGYALDHRYLTSIIQQEIDSLRMDISAGKRFTPEILNTTLRRNIHQRLQRLLNPGLRRVINATGIVLHTNLGRAPLSEPAQAALKMAATHYCNVELDVSSGKRGQRNGSVAALLSLVTGAEAALVVNNCAAAIFLALTALCRGKEVPVSRGELVEIGGSFRMPDVMKSSGAKMREIGTTNKTHAHDYEAAITTRTGALLKVHTSNYRVMGFSQSVGPAALAALAHARDLPLIYDMGSGAMEDTRDWHISPEPVVREVLAAGVDVVTFSGDKLLGGPQSGIIAGKREYIRKIERHHLARALRCDKLILAALEATLRQFLEPDQLTGTLPAARLLSMDTALLRQRAVAIHRQVSNTDLTIKIIDTTSQVGSGALPLEEIPSIALQVVSGKYSAGQLAKRLRNQPVPVIAYIQDDTLLLNLRTVREDEVVMIITALNV